MRFHVVAGALGVSLIASGLALASTSAGKIARPDLVVSSLSNPPSVVFRGRGFTVTDRTRNIGRATARATVTKYFLSANGQRTAAGRRSVVRLRPQRSSRGTTTVTVPTTLEFGTYSLVACADGAAAVRESNERNNCRTAATTVIVKKPPPPV
jgi:subtilase family serine protease